MSLWFLTIILHTLFAVVSFVIGIILLSASKLKRFPWLIKLFIISLIGMNVFMVAATVSHWYDISTTERVIFSGLPALGLYMLYRGIQAKTNIMQDKLSNYIDDIGFILISLFNGFVIVTLIDLSAPPITVPFVALVATVVGSKFIKSIKQKAVN